MPVRSTSRRERMCCSTQCSRAGVSCSLDKIDSPTPPAHSSGAQDPLSHLILGEDYEIPPVLSIGPFFSRRSRPRPSGRCQFPNRPAGQSVLFDQLRSEGAAGVRACRGDAAFLLVFGRGEGLPRRAQGRSPMRDRHVGSRIDPHAESAGRAGRIAEGRRAGASGDR